MAPHGLVLTLLAHALRVIAVHGIDSLLCVVLKLGPNRMTAVLVAGRRRTLRPRVGARGKKQYDRLTLEVGELDQVAVLVWQLEVGRLIAGLEHAATA